jgi:hypothetical protein
MAFINYKGGRFRFAAAAMKFHQRVATLQFKEAISAVSGIARRKEKRPRDEISLSTKNIG